MAYIARPPEQEPVLHSSIGCFKIFCYNSRREHALAQEAYNRIRQAIDVVKELINRDVSSTNATWTYELYLQPLQEEQELGSAWHSFKVRHATSPPVMALPIFYDPGIMRFTRPGITEKGFAKDATYSGIFVLTMIAPGEALEIYLSWGIPSVPWEDPSLRWFREGFQVWGMYQFSSSLDYSLHKAFVDYYNDMIHCTPENMDIVSTWYEDESANDIYYGVSARFFAQLADEKGIEVIRYLLDRLENEQPSDVNGVFRILSPIAGVDAEIFIRVGSFRSYRLQYLPDRCTNDNTE